MHCKLVDDLSSVVFDAILQIQLDFYGGRVGRALCISQYSNRQLKNTKKQNKKKQNRSSLSPEERPLKLTTCTHVWPGVFKIYVCTL